MTGNTRAFEGTFDQNSGPSEAGRGRARPIALVLTLVALGVMALALVGPPASAGYDDSCPLGYIEVDDDYPASSVVNCQFKTLLEVELLLLQPTDVIVIHNGSYLANWTISINGLTIIGDAREGVFINNTAPLTTPLVVNAWDTNITNVTLYGSSNGLVVNGPTNRTALMNLTISTAGGWGCACQGANIRVLNMKIMRSPNGFYSSNVGLEADGLEVNVTAGSWKVVLQGDNLRVVNVTAWGGPSSAILYYAGGVGSNVTIRNLAGENATYGIIWNAAAANASLQNIFIRNVSSGYYGLADGLVSFTNFVLRDAVYGLHPQSGFTQALNLRGGDFSNVSYPVYWYYGRALNISESAFGDTPNNGIDFTVSGATLELSNVSLYNVSQYAVYVTSAVNWTGGWVNATNEGLYMAWGSASANVSNVTFTNIGDNAVIIDSASTKFRFENNTVARAYYGVTTWGQVDGARINNNRFASITYSAVSVYGNNLQAIGNNFTNVLYALQFYVQASDGPWHYNEIPTNNVIEGQPIYYLINATDVAVPSNASMVIIINSTNVSVANLLQPQGANGVQVTLSRNVSIIDSVLVGNNGIFAYASDRVAVRNVSQYAVSLNNFFSGSQLTNVSIVDSLAYSVNQQGQGVSLTSVIRDVLVSNLTLLNVSQGFYLYDAQNVTISRVSVPTANWGLGTIDTGTRVTVDSTFAIGGPLWVYYSSLVTVSNTLFLNSTSYGVYSYSSNFVNLTNVTVLNSASQGIYMDLSGNWTVRNSTFAVANSFGAYLLNSPWYRTYNSTYVSLTTNSFYLDQFSHSLIAIHNNFYGGAIYNGYGYGTWDGGWPVAGNYYDYAAGAFLDEYTGPGQNTLRGKDGVKDAPAYPIGGGRNDNYALMDPWPPTVNLTSPSDGGLITAGTPINLSISNFFDLVTYTDDAGGNGTLVYPHDINTTGWADGWHNITVTAVDTAILNLSLRAPTVTRTFSFEFDSTGPLFAGTPALGTLYIARGTLINITAVEAHLNASYYILDGVRVNRSLDWSIDTSGLAAGSHTLDLFANDTLNNTRVYNWTFFIDDVFPTLTLLGPLADDYFAPGTAITYSASDELNLSRVSFSAVEAGLAWSYSGDLVANGSDWSVDTSLFLDGCYDLQVFATDGAGHITPDARPFCVDSTAPDLSAFVDFGIEEDVDFLFDGALVNDLDWDPAYVWTFDDAALLAPQVLIGVGPTWMFDTPGDYNIHLAVTDRAGNFAEADFTLFVYDLSNPVPDFTVPPTWDEDTELLLDGTSSWDNDGYWDNGNNGTFDWNITGDNNFSLDLTGQTALLNLSDPGWYNITLLVTDRYGNWEQLTVEIQINDTHAPTVLIDGSTATRNEGALVNLDGSRSFDNDPASSVALTWTYRYNSQDFTVSGPVLSIQAMIPGTYTFTLTGVDRWGNEASESVTIRINDIPAVSNTPPSTIQATNIFEWTVTKADSDTGDVHTYSLPSAPSGMAVSASGVVTWPTTEGSYGIYNITLRLADPFSSVDYSFILTVTRSISGTNSPPFFRSFPVQSGTPGSPYAYAVIVADPDVNDHLSVALLAGPAGMTVDSSNTVHWQIPANATDNTVFEVSLALSDGLEQVWQNYTIRVRANNAQPNFVTGVISSTLTVQEGQELTILLAGSATDSDDAFDALTFYAEPTDGTLVSVRVGQTTTGQPAIFVKGLKAGSTVLTIRVADPSGLARSMDVSATVTGAPSVAGGLPMTLVFALAGLIGAGVVGIVVMRRRKKGDEGTPLGGTPAAPAAAPPARPSAPAAEEVQVEVVQAPAAASAAPSIPPAAVALPLAAAIAAAAARPAPPPEVAVAPPKPSKGATYVIEGLFVIYQDGRMIYSKTDIGQQQLGDPELVSSMFTAVTQFIKDSFSAEGELNKMGYGENQILIERGSNVYMAVITFGEPDKELQETMQTAIEKMAYGYAGIIENWDGQQNRFEKIDQYVGPVLALTQGVTRQDVLAATTTKDVKVLSQLEFFQGFVRLKVGIKNDTEAVITKVTLDIDYNEDVLRLQRIEPASYKTSGARVMLNVLNPGEKSSVAFYFDPQICTETNIDGIVRFRDYKGVLQSVTMKTRKAEVVCPLFFTKEHANTAMLKRLIENELQEKDSKVYSITKLPPYVKHKDIFDVCKGVVLSHDVHMVREFVSYNPFAGEAWFYGETKVKGYKIVIRAAVREDNTIEFFAASSVIKAVTGLLAEFNHTLVSMIVERYSDVKIEQLYDEAKKHEIQGKSLVERLGESEAGAGETEQPR